MPTLSSKRLYSEQSMMRALLRAGEFAHLLPSDIRGALDQLYKWVRFESDEDKLYYRKANADLAVPQSIIQAVNGRLMQRAFSAYTPIFIAHECGILCSLCGTIDNRYAYWRNTLLPERFRKFISPSHMTIIDKAGIIEPYKEPSPTCCYCDNQLGGFLSRRGYWVDTYNNRGPDAEAENLLYTSGLAWLSQQQSFRKRLKANGHNLDRCRFDPRSRPWER